MAIRTQRVTSFEDDSIVLSFDWDDANGQVTLVRCVNNSPIYGVYVIIRGTGSGQAGRSRDGTFNANTGTTEISIPGGQRPRYPVTIDPEDGITPHIGGYTIAAWTLA